MPLFLLMLFLAAEIVPVNPDIPYQQPQVASDGADIGIVFGSKGSIYFTLNGSSPVLVGDAPGLSLGNHRGPRLAFTTKAIVVSAGVGPAGQEYGLNTVRTWRSLDHGKTWTAGPDISTPRTGGMGFQALGSDGNHRLVAAWIGPQDGAPRLFTASSEDDGLTWSKQTILSKTVCECCHPNIGISAGGTVRILFRNSVDGDRDFYLATAHDGGQFEIAKLGQGSWKLNACPMDGGGLGEFEGSVISLWRREGELFFAKPESKTEELLGPGRNASITLRKNGSYAVWSTPGGIMAKVPGQTAYVLSKTGAYPVLPLRGPVLAVWEDAGRIVSQRLDGPR